ncbi:MAG: hypothetical protein GY708_22580 [Actinomycetia bacterium]|nr:hypothetical protein [Actinomycetes bacterium]
MLMGEGSCQRASLGPDGLDGTDGLAGVPVEFVEAVAAVEKALAADVGVLGADVRRECVGLLTGLRNRVEALDAATLWAADDPEVYATGPEGGSASLRALLYRTCNGHKGALAGRTTRAGKLQSMPLVNEAFRAGLVTIDHVRLLGELTQPRFFASFVDAEAILVGWACSMGWDDFYKAIEAWRTAADESEPDLKDHKDRQARSVRLARGWKDRGDLDGTLTPEARQIVGGELDRIALMLLKHDRAEATKRLGRDDITNSDLARTPQQRRHDALVIIAERSNGADADATMASPLLYIRTTDRTLAAALAKAAGIDTDAVAVDDLECEFDDCTQLTHSQLVKYLIDAKIRTVVQGGDGEILHFGKTRRWFTRAQKEALAYRDRFCECGCGLLARHVDADHHIAWEDLGDTDLTNAVARCRTTHTRKTINDNAKRREQRQQRNETARQQRLAQNHTPIHQRPSPPVFGQPPTDPDPPF